MEVHCLNFDKSITADFQRSLNPGYFHDGHIKRNFRRRWGAANGDFSTELVLEKHECLSLSFQSLLKCRKSFFVAKNGNGYWRNRIGALEEDFAARLYNVAVDHSIGTNKPIAPCVDAN